MAPMVTKPMPVPALNAIDPPHLHPWCGTMARPAVSLEYARFFSRGRARIRYAEKRLDGHGVTCDDRIALYRPKATALISREQEKLCAFSGLCDSHHQGTGTHGPFRYK